MFLASLSFTAAVSFAGTAGAAVKVEEIRHWSNPSHTRVVIGLDAEASFKDHLLKKDPSINKPRRLYVDIRPAVLGGGLPRSIDINDGLLLRVRSGQNTKTTVRVVLDIESIESYRVYALKNPYRIVIDVEGVRRGKGGGGPGRGGGKGEVRGRAAPPRRQAPGAARRKVVLIDPGHGGKDPGAIGRRGLKEKDVVLRLAKLVAAELRTRKDLRVILTRSSDVFIPLEERAGMAIKHDADLFVSIHANASPRRRASGVETYFPSKTSDRKALEIAARENNTTVKEMSDLQYILFDLQMTASRDLSIRMASFVQDSVIRNLASRYKGIKGNGVKGAPFYVLAHTPMPSILVEVSYISNPVEEKRLASRNYLERLARGIAAGVLRYIDEADDV